MKICVAPLRARFVLELAQPCARAPRFDRQIAVEGEALAVQAGGHQREQQRGRADERNDAHAARVREPDERAPGIGDGRAPRFGQQAAVLARSERRDAARAARARRVFVERGDAAFRAAAWG